MLLGSGGQAGAAPAALAFAHDDLVALEARLQGLRHYGLLVAAKKRAGLAAARTALTVRIKCAPTWQ